MSRILPAPTPETAHFWAGCRNGHLLLQWCRCCLRPYFPPRPFCPRCSSRDIELRAASGRARLYSYVINHRPRPEMGTAPHAIAVVELEEGVRLMTNIVNCPQTPEGLVLDMKVAVRFSRESDEITLPLFEPLCVGTS